MNSETKSTILVMLEGSIYSSSDLATVEQVLKILPAHKFRVEITKDKKFYEIKPNISLELLKALLDGNEEEIEKLCLHLDRSIIDARHDATTIGSVMANLRG